MDIVQSLIHLEAKYKNKTKEFGDLNIEAMAYDCRTEIEKLRNENAMLRTEVEALSAFKDSFDRLYRKGFSLEDWHLNESCVTFDEYYEHVLDSAGLG